VFSGTRIVTLVALVTATAAGATLFTAERARAAEPSAAETAQPLSLERALELVLVHDERAAQAAESRVAAEARVDKARSFFFPSLTLTGNYLRRGRASQFQEHNALNATLAVSLTLFDARGIPLYRQAAYERRAATLEESESRRLLGFEAADAYLATLGQERVVAAAQHRLEFARQSLADAKGRASAQIASSNDVTKAELEAATAERELVRAQAQLETAYLELGHLVGARVAPPLVEPRPLLDAAATPGGDAKTLVAQAQARRLDIAANREHARSAEEFAREPGMRWLPALGLTGQYKASNEAGLAGSHTDWFIGLTATWVVFDGGVRSADAEERGAEAEIARLDVRAGLRQVALDVEKALVELAHAQELEGKAQAAVDAARKNVSETNALYKQGLARALEVADATAGLYDAEVALAQESYGLGVALLDLRAALGLDPLGREPKKS
jgi:outer membrane protein TolC